MNLRTCKVSDVKWLSSFYKKTVYGGTFSENDDLYFVEEDEKVLGVIRIAFENDVHVLRGMQVLETHRGLGIGTKLLNYLNASVTNDPIYCIPYKRLAEFYESIGFKVIDKVSAPEFLISRLNEYLSKDMDVLLMMRGSIPHNKALVGIG